MKYINFGIIGCGRIASRHAKHINKFGKLLAVCDIIDEKSKSLAKMYNANSYDDIEKLLKNEKNIDVISICTPNGLHAIHSIKSLNAGFNVLCEKPLALSSKDCGEMIKAAERNNKRLFAIKQNRFNPPIQELKKLIDKNILGEIFSVQLNCFWNRNEDYYKNSWKGDLELDGGTLFTQFSHFIDLLYWFFGDVSHVNGFSNNFNHNDTIDFEDSGVVSLKFENGVLGTINYSVNTYSKNFEGSILVIAEKGTVKVGGQYLNVLEYQNIEGYKVENLPAGNKSNNYGNYQGSMSNHDLVYKNLIKVLKNEDSINASAFDGLKTVEIIEKIYKKIRN